MPEQESQQHAASRAPKKRISYAVQTPEETMIRELPFVVGVLADISGVSAKNTSSIWERKFIGLSQDNIDAVQASVLPRLSLDVPNRLETVEARLRVDLRFSSLSDFEPSSIVRQVPALRELSASTSAERDRRSATGTALGSFLDQVLQQTEAQAPQYQAEGFATDSERVLSMQLDEILRAPALQQLAATWHGLRHLTARAADKPDVKVYVLDAGKKTLTRDFEKAAGFDQTWVFKRVHDDVFGVLGCWPFGLLIGDYEFSNHPEDLGFLERMSEVAATIGAPMVAAASPGMFGIEQFELLSERGALERLLEGPGYERWRSFRKSALSRYAALALPRVVFPVSEEAAEHKTRAWGNPGYVFAARLIDIYSRDGDFVASRGADGEPGSAVPAVETAFTELQARHLSDLGFLALARPEGARRARFVETRPCHKPARYANPVVSADARLASDLRCVLAVSRIVNYVKVQMIEESHAGKPAREYVGEIDRWLQTCVASGLLRQARLELLPGAGAQVALHVLPDLGPEKLTSPIRVVMALP